MPQSSDTDTPVGWQLSVFIPGWNCTVACRAVQVVLRVALYAAPAHHVADHCCIDGLSGGGSHYLLVHGFGGGHIRGHRPWLIVGCPMALLL